MKTHRVQLQDILDAFERKKILTKKEILQAAGCSTMTAWRLLRSHGYLTSYNDNARHYTLANIPRFDEHGLWEYQKVRFSKWGSLTKTIVALIDNSASGMTPAELEQRMHVRNVKPTLSRLIQRQSVTRETIHGRSVYLSLADRRRAKQQQQREKENRDRQPAHSLPPLEHIIAVLVEMIQRPRRTPSQWARQLRRQGVRMGTDDIRAVMDHYGIDLKKGLLNS
jgi:hypothetical protein